jgi:hypothetical protein
VSGSDSGDRGDRTARNGNTSDSTMSDSTMSDSTMSDRGRSDGA